MSKEQGKYSMDAARAFNRAATLCARRERCSSDIEKKLVQWGVSPSIIDEVIKKLHNENYINEERYTGFFVRDKLRFNNWGRHKIRYHLKHKKISASVIEDALDMINSDEYISILEHILRVRAKTIKEKDAYKKKASLVRFASSRGFEMDLIFTVLDQIL